MSEKEKAIGEKLIGTLNEAANVLTEGEKLYIQGVADGMLAARACSAKGEREHGACRPRRKILGGDAGLRPDGAGGLGRRKHVFQRLHL